MRRDRRPLALLVVPLAVALVTVASATPPATAATSSVTVARGVTLTHSTFSFHGPQSLYTLRIALSAKTRLVAASPQNLIGSPRLTTLALGRQERAVAGINGDTFYFSDPTAQPRGGITHEGRILKSSNVTQTAVLYVRNGVATIGNPGFSGRITTTDRAGRARSYGITSRNSLENAENGGMALVDRTVLSSSLQKPPGPNHTCAVVRLRDVSTGRYRVTSIAYSATRYTRAAVGTHALVSCAAATKTWIRSALGVGRTLDASAGYRVPGITTLISAGRQLIRAGKRYDDPKGVNEYGNQQKPETFGCVLAGGRTVQLGVFEGDRRGVAGVTYAQLTTYLLQRRCVSAVVFDGSGSATLVAKRPGGHLAVQNRTTAPGGPRQVVDGLFVVSR